MEKVCAEHRERLQKLEECQSKLLIELAKIEGSVEHIKTRIDNGMSTTISNINKMLLTDVVPNIKDNTWWVGVLKKAIIFVSITAVTGGLIALAFHLIKAFDGFN